MENNLECLNMITFMDKRKQYLKEYFKNNKELINKRRRENYNLYYKYKQKEHNKNYENKSRDKINKYKVDKKKNDVNFKIITNIRSRVYQAIKSNAKKTSTIELLGCTIEFLKIYLQSKFNEGMTWDNYGKWHIDHIVPCIKFNMTKEQEQKKCFHYTNLQPLWAKDNISKGCK